MTNQPIPSQQNNQHPIVIKYNLTHPSALPPKKAHPEDAAFDLYAPEAFTLLGNSQALIHTWVCLEIPVGYYWQIFGRSGLAKDGFTVLWGVIDSNYRGEIGVILRNLSPLTRQFQAWDRIAQLVILPVPNAILQEQSSLSETDRGNSGYGSSGN